MSKFLSKFVNRNSPSLSANDAEGRSRTISDAGPLRSRTVSAAISTDVPSFTLTSENGDSPVQPSTPGSLHRSNSRGSSNERRGRAESLSAVERTSSHPSLTSSGSPLNPRKSLDPNISTARPGSSGSGSSAVQGLDIDLGTSETKIGAQAAATQDNASASANTNGLDRLRHKLSSKSLKSQRKPSPPDTHPQEPVPSFTPVMFTQSAPPASQVVEVPPRTRSMELVDSPETAKDDIDNTPTTASFAPPEIDTAALSPSLSAISAKSGRSLPPSVIDSDAVSIASVNKKKTWRTGGNDKKRKPTGLASAIASSGLAMANPGITQSLQQQFVPPPVPPNSPPRQNGNPVKRSFSGGSAHKPKSASTSSRTRVNGAIVAEDAEAALYTDDESEDGLDLDDVPVTGFAVASNKRNAEFHEMFQSVPEGDYLIEDYGCALQREILIQGRLYISENHICFHANIFGWVTDLIIPVHEIQLVEKRMTALFIPNAIQITTRTAKYTFASFLSRDTTYDVIHNVWNLARPDTESILSASSQPVLDPNFINTPDGHSDLSRQLSPFTKSPTACECSLSGSHYTNTCMQAVFPGTPEKIYNLMFTSEFIKDFWRNEQNLKDLQISDWIPDPSSKLLTRKFSYIKILNGIVKQTKCELSDSMRHCDFDQYVTMETTTRTPDVPSGNVFEVKTLTCITWAGPATTKVTVTTQVDWSGRSFIKSMITSASIDGQKTYHKDLESAMRKYISENKTEFIPEGLDIPETPPVVVDEKKEDGLEAPPLSTEEAGKKREHERNQRATQWAFDTFMGAYRVAKQSTLDALDLVGDAWDQSSSTTILYFVIVVLVFSNIWTFFMVGRREEVGRRKEMIKNDEQRKLVSSIVAALHEEHTQHKDSHRLDFLESVIPSSGEGLKVELVNLLNLLDSMEERVKKLKQSLNELD